VAGQALDVQQARITELEQELGSVQTSLDSAREGFTELKLE
jgi:hypothetical protein